MSDRFTVSGAGGVALRGEAAGSGPTVIVAHGLTAHRNLVVHGSRALERKGHRVVAYDARGHGESDPAEPGGYGYERLADDLLAVIAAEAGEGRPLLAGHSMGAHTIATAALRDPEPIAGIVLIGPASTGAPPPPDALAEWDELAAGLERGGIEGFLDAYERQGIDPDWHDTVVRITRERLGVHRHPEAVAEALREVPRSVPFDGLDDLAGLELPALVVASHDQADPGHPRDVAAAWAEALPEARLIGEEPGESPLAWQGGKLSREIAAFAAEPPVAARLDD